MCGCLRDKGQIPAAPVRHDQRIGDPKFASFLADFRQSSRPIGDQNGKAPILGLQDFGFGGGDQCCGIHLDTILWG